MHKINSRYTYSPQNAHRPSFPRHQIYQGLSFAFPTESLVGDCSVPFCMYGLHLFLFHYLSVRTVMDQRLTS